MRIHAKILAVVCLLLPAIGVQGQTAASTSLAIGNQRAKIVEGYGELPLAFEANRGQSDSQVKFLSRGAGYGLYLTPTEAVLALKRSAVSHQHSAKQKPSSAVLRIKLLNASRKSIVSGQEQLPGRSNYFVGNDPKKWHTDVRHYAKVRYANIYPGVDLVYYGNQRELEYDFVLQPGANPEQIRLDIEGANRIRVERSDVILTSATGEVRLRSPRIYQDEKGIRHEIGGRYLIKSNHEVGFELAAYNRRRMLVIDPVLAYSTYLGGSGSDYGNSIAVDMVGNAYVTGSTTSADFPMANPIQPTLHGNADAYVTKFNADGSAIVYSTYLGGGSDDAGFGVAVDSAGNAYVTGETDSTDFPTVNAKQPTYGGGDRDAFVVKINPAGSALVYSTYLGGSGSEDAYGGGIAVDATGRAYVTGTTTSTDFPTANAIQPTFGGGEDAFVTKINAAGSAFVYSTYLGGSGVDRGGGIAVNATGDAYVTGGTDSIDFPTANAFQPTLHSGSGNAFVSKLNAAGSAFVYSTYLGGTQDPFGASSVDLALSIAVDNANNAYVTGETDSIDFPIANAIQPTYGGSWGRDGCNEFMFDCPFDAFVTKINPKGNTLVYSTYLGGMYRDAGYSIAVDGAGSAYVTGFSESPDFPSVNAIDAWGEVFVTKINSDGTAFTYSTRIHSGGLESGNGIAVDASGSSYVTGRTAFNSFHTTPLAFQQSLKGKNDAFILKIAPQNLVSVSPQSLSFPQQALGTAGKPKKIIVTNNGSGLLTINKIYIGGANPDDFSQTNTCGSSLPAGASCSVSVTFTPTGKRKRPAMLGISDSDPASPQGAALSGTGTVVSLSKTTLSFGKRPVGTTSAPQNVILTNVGSTQLNFTGITITGTNAGDYSQSNTCGTSIAARANCTITVTFTPTATGKRKAAVSISDDGGGSPQEIQLTGTGT